MTSRHILIAFGANLPGAHAPADTLRAAMKALRARGLTLCGASKLYATPCMPEGAGPDYVNAVARFCSGFSPADTMDLLHDVEERLGRVRAGRWGARVVDLDLLAVDDLVIPDPETYEAWRSLPAEAQPGRAPDRLILPHPRLQDRAFVLVPLAEIAPDWVHPVLGASASALRDALPAGERARIRPLEHADFT